MWGLMGSGDRDMLVLKGSGRHVGTSGIRGNWSYFEGEVRFYIRILLLVVLAIKISEHSHFPRSQILFHDLETLLDQKMTYLSNLIKIKMQTLFQYVCLDNSGFVCRVAGGNFWHTVTSQRHI